MKSMSLPDPLYALSGFIVGLLVGQTGVGGGSLMTPLLVLLFGVHPTTAVGTDLLHAAASQSVGTLVHGSNKAVAWHVVGRLAAGSVPTTFLTLLVSAHVNLMSPGARRIVTAVLGVALLLTAAALVLRRWVLAALGPVVASFSAHTRLVLTVACGAVLGVLVSISSVGAGAVGVTVLILLYPELPMARIVGSDIAHAVPLTLLAGAGHWWLGAVDWPLLGSLLTGAIPGVVIGSYLAPRVLAFVLRPIPAIVLCVVGGRLVI
jgi:uncharacterized membrane protein YfcA